jgi:hypothetical protein
MITSSGTNDPNAANNSDSETTGVSGSATADVGLQVTDNPDPTTAGAQITYQVAVTSASPPAGDIAANVVVNMTIPAGTTFSQMNVSSGIDCSTPAIGGTTPVVCTIPTVTQGNGSPVVYLNLLVTVSVGTTGTVTETATITSSGTNDPNAANNSDSETTTITPPNAVALGALSAAATARGVLVRWQCPSAAGVLGYRVYRETNARVVRVSAGLIPARSSGVGGARYSFLDRRAPRGVRLRYSIEAVLLNGARIWLGRTSAVRLG